MRNGWIAAISEESVSFLTADMEVPYKFDIAGIIGISECTLPQTNLHLLALISTGMIEVFQC